MSTKTSIARAKPNLFGVPSLETARAIDDSDKAAGLQAAHYRLSARMRELEAQYDVKASELRAAFVSECPEIIGGRMNSRSAVLIALSLSAWSGAIIGAIFAAAVTLAICCR